MVRTPISQSSEPNRASRVLYGPVKDAGGYARLDVTDAIDTRFAADVTVENNIVSDVGLEP